MVAKITIKIMPHNSGYRIYLQKSFVTDSQFPFKEGEVLTMRIVGNIIKIEKESI